MPNVTRRGFINLAGRAGGAAALYNTLGAMGLLAAPSARAGPPELPAGSDRGIHVAILGAGIAGMTAGYELRKHLYNVYHLLNHLNLFGGGYLAQVRSTLRLLARAL